MVAFHIISLAPQVMMLSKIEYMTLVSILVPNESIVNVLRFKFLGENASTFYSLDKLKFRFIANIKSKALYKGLLLSTLHILEVCNVFINIMHIKTNKNVACLGTLSHNPHHYIFDKCIKRTVS